VEYQAYLTEKKKRLAELEQQVKNSREKSGINSTEFNSPNDNYQPNN